MDEKKLYSTQDLMALIMDEVHRTNQDVAAKKLGISRSYLCDVLQGKRGIGPKVFDKLGYEQVLRWRKK